MTRSIFVTVVAAALLIRGKGGKSSVSAAEELADELEKRGHL